MDRCFLSLLIARSRSDAVFIIKFSSIGDTRSTKGEIGLKAYDFSLNRPETVIIITVTLVFVP